MFFLYKSKAYSSAGFGLIALALLAQSAQAQVLEAASDATIRDQLCVGNGCADDPSPDFPDASGNSVMIVGNRTRLDFVDNSTLEGYPDNNWALIANSPQPYGESYFAIRDETAGANPFVIAAGAPISSLYVAEDGDIGLGTSMPRSELHIVSDFIPSIRLEQDGSGGATPYTWAIYASDLSFSIGDTVKDTYPLRIDTTTVNGAALFYNNGLLLNLHQDENFNFNVKSANDPFAFFVRGGTDNVGIGTAGPETTLHLKRDGGDTQLKIEETNGTQAARPLLNMVNHGRPDIIMANTATGGEWAFGAGTNFVLKNGAVGSSDGDKDLQLKLYGATGNLEIAGQIITGGPTCAGGCDAVFSEDYDLPSIEEHAEAMFALGHLPNVGPTAPNAPVNMSEQYGKLLNELEHAHIYIARQQALIARMNARLESVEARLAEN